MLLQTLKHIPGGYNWITSFPGTEAETDWKSSWITPRWYFTTKSRHLLLWQLFPGGGGRYTSDGIQKHYEFLLGFRCLWWFIRANHEYKPTRHRERPLETTASPEVIFMVHLHHHHHCSVLHHGHLHAGGELLLPVLGWNPRLLVIVFLSEILLFTLFEERRVLITESRTQTASDNNHTNTQLKQTLNWHKHTTNTNTTTNTKHTTNTNTTTNTKHSTNTNTQLTQTHN